MQQLQLSNNKYTTVDDEDYRLFGSWKWYVNSDGYAMRHIPKRFSNTRKLIGLHRLILWAPEGMQVDHIDGDRLNNRRSNLRVVTLQQNVRNRKRNINSSSKYKGVSRHGQSPKWRARIRLNGKGFYLGLFDTEEEAALAYNTAAVRLHAEAASLNVIVKWQRAKASV